jgi:hypothetical protein
VDYDYFTSRKAGKGFYFLAGAGLARVSLDVTATAPTGNGAASGSKTTLFPELGLGCAFTRHLGVEVAYRDVRSQVNFMDGAIPVQYSLTGTVQASLVVRF